MAAESPVPYPCAFFRRNAGKPGTSVNIAPGARAAIRRPLIGCLLLGVCLAASARTACATESLLHQQAPEFMRRDLNGASVDLASLRGKVVLLNFWASWCASCLIEMPTFAQWQRQYGPQGLRIIGISIDDDPALARKFSAKLKLSYPVVMGDEKLGELYGGILGLPLTYLIDRDGNIRAKFQGETDPRTIQTKLHELLTQP